MTVEEFRDVVGLWHVDRRSAADVVRAACDLLVAGVDGPAMSRLAAASVRTADDEVPLLLEDAMTEVGLEHHHLGSDGGLEAGVRAMARLTLAGELSPRELARWAHRWCGHDRLELADGLALLDDVYDERELAGLTEEDVDEEVLAEVRRITA
ncbi:hypothetical protein [Lentzea flava]|uniref:DUF4259 domain-containing protein n=1 Tax=Lentzea flava TaxID=103732 RepID=A0ABQ2VB67_9PSEU|nr:hypothetical protein [Lentzea flava]MCP2204168.1 hypothetical protein [Lentzea flava]GGU74991.1 hypothetical protein GCM10010178_78030 [Lentzea flava]